MFLYAGTILLSAFLLFMVQPIIARMILPWFGGTSAVWTTCMLFFQGALLLGYLYVDWGVRKLSAQRHTQIHIGLLLFSLLLLPILPSDRWKPDASGVPTIQILVLLAVCVGLPYFLLSTTSPLVQSWYVRSKHGALPYRLFALSNFGSLVALLGYPLLVEPQMSAWMQGVSWSVLYGAFVVLCVVTAVLSLRAHQAGHASTHTETQTKEAEANAEAQTKQTDLLHNGNPSAKAQASKTAVASKTAESAGKTDASKTAESSGKSELPLVVPTWGTRVLWLVYAALPSALLLAVTSHLTHDVATVPFLWVLPLALYLLTFILCFDADGWYRREIFFPLLVVVLGGTAWMLHRGTLAFTLVWAVVAYSTSFFVLCMVCHGEMVRSKPHPRYLTTFYLMLSVGGAVGGLFVAVISPLLFSDYHEFPILLVACAVVAVLSLLRDPASRFFKAWRHPVIVVMQLGVIALCAWGVTKVRKSWEGKLLVQRNFYGVVRVADHTSKKDPEQNYRVLYHGAIRHGEQWLDPKRHRELVTFYCPNTGAGRAIEHQMKKKTAVKVGVLGLGVGTLAGYARAGDTYRFYEINPDVIALAEQKFYYLSSTRKAGAQVQTIPGDARLSMEREPKQQYDVLAVDCFSSDAIPVHLLTKEAVALYFSHLQKDGILALHISNRFLDLAPVIKRIAEALGKAHYQIETDDDDYEICFGTTWVLLANDPAVFQQDSFKKAGKPIASKKKASLWTDSYSSLFEVLMR